MERIPSRNQNEIIMKIGILTFHWATNYGAVLQCYALQEYLSRLGHDVKVINYKPLQFDDSLCNFFRQHKFLDISAYFIERNREKALKVFRRNFLHLTPRITSCSQLSTLTDDFDLIISGSDQVTNPYFLMNGESNGTVSPTYFLGFQFNGKRVGYALSFGCVSYPDNARIIATKYIQNFSSVSVRENSGIDIIKSMGRSDAIVVPDPTLLMQSEFYHRLADSSNSKIMNSYFYSFFIRHIKERKSILQKVFHDYKMLWNNDDHDYTLSGWIFKIKNANFVITDSFHCVVMCLKLHKPFIVITEQSGNIGMNDRLYTLLSILKLEDRIIPKNKLEEYEYSKSIPINWTSVDDGLNSYSQIGKKFLEAI